jgi:hypothetical protein
LVYKEMVQAKTITIVAMLAIAASPTLAQTDVFLFYGFGDNFAGTSSGIDDIAARARTIRGVSSVNVRNYWETQRVYDEVRAVPADHRIVIGGYSCGLNAATVVSRGLWQANHHVSTVVGIQQSVWCGGDALESNVKYGQSTFNGDCRQTWGLGCKPLEPAPSFQGRIVNINRPDSHGAADNDPDAQADVLKAIALTAIPGNLRPPKPPIECRWAWTSQRGWVVACGRPPSGRRNIEIVRRRGQRAY